MTNRSNRDVIYDWLFIFVLFAVVVLLLNTCGSGHRYSRDDCEASLRVAC